jgi:hypothetical protein
MNQVQPADMHVLSYCVTSESLTQKQCLLLMSIDITLTKFLTIGDSTMAMIYTAAQ